MSDFDARMRALGERFVARCAEDLPRLKDCLASRADTGGDLRFIVHRMAGSAGLFGHDAIGTLAAEVEDELWATHAFEAKSLSNLTNALESLLATRAHPIVKL